MDILLFIPTSGGGAEKVSVNYANILYRKGLKLKIIFLSKGKNSICEYLDKNIESEILYSKNKISRYFGIIKSIYTYKPKIVFSSLTAISSILICSKILFPSLKVVTRQCFMPGRIGGYLEKTIKFLFKFSDINIAQTTEMAESMIQLYKLKANKVITINNPLDIVDIQKKIKNINRPNTNLWRFISIGRISPVKDYPTLIKAFSLVCKEEPKSTLLIIGQPENESIKKDLIDYIRYLNLSDKISFIDYTTNPYEYLIQSNCFVLSSVSEGLPNALNEALFLNIPCVATRCIPYIKQRIKDGENGYSVRVKDFEDLSNAMIKAAKLYGTIQNKDTNNEIQEKLIKTFTSLYIK